MTIASFEGENYKNMTQKQTQQNYKIYLKKKEEKNM